MLGCGNVGAEVARLLVANASDLASRAGVPLILTKIAVRDLTIDRPGIPKELFTTDSESIVNDPEIDLVIEVMGGIEPAHELILTAMRNGKAVVTANKALLAHHGAELFHASDEADVDFYYEAAVAGAIPILRPLAESLVGDHVERVMGIINGTTNFILTKMHEHPGFSFADALKEAQDLGYAEADPTADVEGFDAAAKAAILAGLSFHSVVTDADVYREGITKITAEDVAVVQDMGFVIKLLAIAEANEAHGSREETITVSSNSSRSLKRMKLMALVKRRSLFASIQLRFLRRIRLHQSAKPSTQYSFNANQPANSCSMVVAQVAHPLHQRFWVT